MNRRLVLEAACLRRQCSDCHLGEYGCGMAPTNMLLQEARKHYAYMKNDVRFDGYDRVLTRKYGMDYAKEFMPKAKVV